MTCATFPRGARGSPRSSERGHIEIASSRPRISLARALLLCWQVGEFDRNRSSIGIVWKHTGGASRFALAVASDDRDVLSDQVGRCGKCDLRTANMSWEESPAGIDDCDLDIRPSAGCFGYRDHGDVALR